MATKPLRVNVKIDVFKEWAERSGWCKVGEEYYEKGDETYLCYATQSGNIVMLSGENNIVTDIKNANRG